MLRKIVATLVNLRETVTGSYGPGTFSYVKFIYISFFSLNTFKIFSLDLEAYAKGGGSETDDFSLHAATIEQLRSFRQGKKLPREFYYDEIHDLSVCHVAARGTDIAYIHWLYYPGRKSRFFHLEKGVVEVNNCLTMPSYRGRNLMARVCGFTALTLKGSEARHLLMVIHKDNVASIKSAQRAGFRELREIRSLGPFNGKVRTSSLVPDA